MPVLGQDSEISPSKEDGPGSIHLMCQDQYGGQGETMDFSQDLPRASEP